MNNTARIDKFLWAVRIFKTRSIAAEACKKGRVTINDEDAKPSRNTKINDIITVRKPPVFYKYIVKDITEKRVGAKLVSTFIDDITTEEELDKLLNKKKGFFSDKNYKGRPTKRDRRKLDGFKENFD